MRLFIAINFSAEIRARLAALREELRCRARHGNFSLDENLHLTLVFLGECSAQEGAAAARAMNEVRFEAFSTAIDRVGRFKRDSGEIWWAGLRENKPLMKLQHDLSERLHDAGFVLDRRKYSPHITLGRGVATDAVPWRVEPFGEPVAGIELMKSERIGGKLTYTAMAERVWKMP